MLKGRYLRSVTFSSNSCDASMHFATECRTCLLLFLLQCFTENTTLFLRLSEAQATLETGNALFYKMKAMPDEPDFPISTSEDLATLMANKYNTTLSEALFEGRLYSRRELKGLGDLPGRSIGGNEDYVMMDARVLLYR